MRSETLAQRARTFLRHSAMQLGTANPLDDVGPDVDEQLAVPYGEPMGETPLSAYFSEQTPEHLNFVMRAVGQGAKYLSNTRAESREQFVARTTAAVRVVFAGFGTTARRTP